ncbi:50S ribosomal protein L19e [Candidatus Woesearchaeota archaeon]|nr:50S ribosomal protein L19e [Candidatus Woesearchaeota archaeon]
MKLNVQKRLAADILNCSPKRVRFDEERLAEIKEAITKIDIKGLIKDKAIEKKPVKSISKGRVRARHTQKKSGRRRGQGSRKGRENARASFKKTWINQVRAQRDLLKRMKEKEKITSQVYRNLYEKSKGGFFRSKKHLKLYIEERHLAKEK